MSRLMNLGILMLLTSTNGVLTEMTVWVAVWLAVAAVVVRCFAKRSLRPGA